MIKWLIGLFNKKVVEEYRYDPYESIRHYYKDGLMPHEIKMAAEEEALRINFKIYEESSK